MQHLRDNVGVLEASNDGTTWTPVQLGTDAVPAEIDNPVMLGTLQLRDNAGGLEVSDDDGVTWVPVGSGAMPAVHFLTGATYAISAENVSGDYFIDFFGLTIEITLPDSSLISNGATVEFITAFAATINPGTGKILLDGILGDAGQGITLTSFCHVKLMFVLDTQTDPPTNEKIWIVLDYTGQVAQEVL